MPDIIFIGAGPVGLWTAIQTKLHNPALDILMFEKYQEYQRKHVLIVEQESFAGAHPDADFQAMLPGITGKVRTVDLEKKLLDFAINLGIHIEYTPVTDLNALTTSYPDTSCIVGTDGARSLVRKTVFKDSLAINKRLQHVVEIKYECVGAVKPLSKRQTLGVLSHCQHLISETVGRTKDNITPVTLRMFVDAETFAQMENATFRTPYHLDEPQKFPPAVYHDIVRWLIARETLCEETRVEKSDKISALHLDVYQSEDVIRTFKGKLWFLGGDAAMGFPFFRSLNIWLGLGSRLANILAQYGAGPMPLAALVEYESMVKKIASYEAAAAQFKSVALDSGAYSLGVGRDISTKVFWRSMLPKELNKKLGQSSPYLAMREVPHKPEQITTAISLQEIKDAIARAVEQYDPSGLTSAESSLSSLLSPCTIAPYSSMHTPGPSGKKRARDLLDSINSATLPYEAWNLIHDLYSQKGGNWHETSFRRILLQELSQTFKHVVSLSRQPGMNDVDALHYIGLLRLKTPVLEDKPVCEAKPTDKVAARSAPS